MKSGPTAARQQGTAVRWPCQGAGVAPSPVSGRQLAPPLSRLAVRAFPFPLPVCVPVGMYLAVSGLSGSST